MAWSSCFEIASGFLLTLCTAIPAVSLPLPFKDCVPSFDGSEQTLNLMRRQNGNPNIAGDIYGLGLRIGAYLQIVGMLLSCIRTRKSSRAGILLLSSAVCLSLFAAWSILVAQQAISPCEAWLILSLSAAYGAPRFVALNETECSRGGIAIVCCMISVLWQQILYLWFFGKLYRQLPLLRTENRAWLFAPVDLDGGFRIFMLVVTCVESLLVPSALLAYLNMALERFVDWTDAKKFDGQDMSSEKIWVRPFIIAGKRASKLRDNGYFKTIVNFGDDVLSKIWGRKRVVDIVDEQERRNEYLLMKWVVARWRIVMSIWAFVVLVLTMAGVEKIIVYNSLYPASDLSKPGQIIPLVLGIITFLVGASHAIKPSVCSNGSGSTGSQPTEFEAQYRSNNLQYFMKDADELSIINARTEEGVQTVDEFQLKSSEEGDD